VTPHLLNFRLHRRMRAYCESGKADFARERREGRLQASTLNDPQQKGGAGWHRLSDSSLPQA
jgi:hypothetical protein